MFEHLSAHEANGFDAKAIDAMVRAYTDICIELRVLAGDERGKLAVARRVFDLAQTGVIDSRALRERVLMEARVAA